MMQPMRGLSHGGSNDPTKVSPTRRTPERVEQDRHTGCDHDGTRSKTPAVRRDADDRLLGYGAPTEWLDVLRRPTRKPCSTSPSACPKRPPRPAELGDWHNAGIAGKSAGRGRSIRPSRRGAPVPRAAQMLRNWNEPSITRGTNGWFSWAGLSGGLVDRDYNGPGPDKVAPLAKRRRSLRCTGQSPWPNETRKRACC